MSGRSGAGASGPHVVVVGGGAAGLAAANDLADAGVRVTVLESRHLGGKIRTGVFAGRPVEEGPDAFLTSIPDVVDLARQVGLADQLVAPRTGRAHLVLDGRLVPLPSAQVLGIPADPEAKDLAAVLDPQAIDRLRSDRSAPGSPPSADDDESLGSFIRRRLGDQVADRLVGPLVGGINAGDIDRLSLAAVTPRIDALARSASEPSLVRAAASALAARPRDAGSPFLAPVGGLGSLVDALVASLRQRGVVLHDDAEVQAVERVDGQWSISIKGSQGGAEGARPLLADGIVLATPADVSARLLADAAPTSAARLASIRYASVALVVLAFDPDAFAASRDGSGFLVARSEGLLCTAASWSSTKWAHLAPERGDGTAVMRVSAGRSGDERAMDLDDADLVEALVDEVSRIMGGDQAPRASRVSRWPSSFPQYAPGHLAMIASVEAELATHNPSIVLAGATLRGVGIPAVVNSGRVAARRLVEVFGEP